MAAEIIGRCTCPVCGSDKASLRLSAKQLSYLHCNSCHLQAFARSDHSDGKLRSLLIADAPSTPAVAIVVPATSPMPPPAAPKRSGWGLLGNA